MSRLRFLSSLRARLILLVLFALTPAIVILILNAAEHRAREAEKAKAQVFSLSQLAALQQDQVLESARQVLISLAAVPEVRGDDPGACTTKLAKLSAEYERYSGLAVVRPNGDLFCRTTLLTTTINVAQGFAFQQALRTSELAVGEYQVGRASGKPNLGVCYPILEDDISPQGVICAGIDLNWLNEVAADFQLPPGAALVVVDRNGTVLVRYPEPEAWVGKNLPAEPLIQTMLQGREVDLAITGPDGIERLYAVTPLRINADQETGVVLAVGIPVGLAYRELNRQLLQDFGVLGLVALLTSALVWWGSAAFVLRQVKALLSAAERLSEGDLSARTGQTQTEGELNQLSRAFDTMAAALEQREHELSQAEKTLRIILQGVADGIVVLDRSGRLQYANTAAAQLMGYDSAESLLEAPPTDIRQKFEIYDEAGQPLSPNQLPGRQVLQGAPQAALTIRYWNKATGEEHWSMDKSTAVFGPDGQVVMAVNILHDITELKRAELFQHLLAEAGRLLAAPLDWQTRLSNVAQLAVPLLADWCAVDVVEYDENIQRISVAHVDPAKIELAYALQQQYPVDSNARGGVPEVLRTGVSQFYPVITLAMVEAGARDERHLQLIKTMNLSSVISVPLLAHGRTLGALTLVWAESGRHYTPADLAVAEEIGRRAGLALDNARLYAETQALNEKLEQRIHDRTAELQATNVQLKNEMAERWAALRRLEESQQQLRQLLAHLQAVHEEERTRLAHVLHDEFGQMLTGLKMDVASLQQTTPLPDTKSRQKLGDMSDLIDESIQSLRPLILELRPDLLDDLGLVATVEWQLSEFKSRTGIGYTFTPELEDESELGAEIKTALFRIFQEALMNVARHAQATVVVVSLEKTPDSLVLQVRDDGLGLLSQEMEKGNSFGLLGIRERVNRLGGELRLEGAPGRGTTLRVLVPLGTDSPEQTA